MAKVIIAGGRDFKNFKTLEATMDYLMAADGANITVDEVVCGCAVGADSLGRSWAQEKGIPVVEFPADWEGKGKRAGIMRNLEMAHYGDVLVAFWDTESKGTKHMIGIAQKKGLQVFVRQYNLKDKARGVGVQ